MVERPSKLQPALLGGLVLGLGSVIPIVSLGNFCCCGWGIAGGALAAYLLIKRSPVLPITKGDGAGAGALAGVVGSYIYLVIGVPLSLLQWSASVSQMQARSDAINDVATRETLRQFVAAMQDHPIFVSLAIWLVFAIVAIGMAAVGGVIGTAIFEKRKGQPYPPQGPPPGPGFPPEYGSTAAPGEPPYSGSTPSSY